MLELAPFQVDSFEGGITDNFIDSPPNTYEEADNLLVTENRKLYTRPGSVLYSSTYPQLPSGNQRIGAIIDHYDVSQAVSILFTSAKKLFYLGNLGWNQLQGPTGNDVFTAGDITSRVTWCDWNNHTFVANDDYSPVMKIFRDGTSALRVRSAGLPALASTPTTTGGTAGTNSYIWGIFYKYTYTVGTVTHVESGPVTYVQKINMSTPNANPITITGIPSLANGSLYNYDTTAIKIEIYRTEANGTSLTYVGEVANGIAPATVNFIDNFSDATIAGNQILYTDGDVLDNYPPPLCKTLHVTDSFALYGNVKVGTETFSNRIYQSKPDQPSACHPFMTVDVDDEIVAISSVGQTPVVLCRRSIYRLDGYFTSKGEGALQAQEIESTVGCISMNSVVQMQRGIAFASESGFYFTDGLEVRKLSLSFNDTYSSFTQTAQQRERIYGCFDRISKRVWWSVQTSIDPAADVDKIYVLDSRYGLGVAGDDLENRRVCFTTCSGGSSFVPTATLFRDSILYRADVRGYIFSHSDGITSDPLVDLTKATTAWDFQAIIWSYKSMASSLGSTLKRKFVNRVVFTSENSENISVQINSINDVGKSTYALKPIRFRKFWTWGDPIITWGDSSQVWNYKGVIEEARRFDSNGLRCSYKQVQFTNAYTVIVASDDLTTVTCDTNAGTATLDNIADYDFPSNLVGYSIYFAGDNYTKGYEIRSHGVDTLTLNDPDFSLPSTSQRWEIRGYPKNEVLNLVSYAIWYSYLGQPLQYLSSSSGSNK